MIIGVTATQRGLTELQLAKAEYFFRRNPGPYMVLRHGDCTGGDAELHALMAGLYPGPGHIVIHPPSDPKKRAWMAGYVEIREPKPYQERNHDIMDESELCLAFPHNYEWYPHSGTWSTITYCQRQGYLLLIIYPDGTIGT